MDSLLLYCRCLLAPSHLSIQQDKTLKSSNKRNFDIKKCFTFLLFHLFSAKFQSRDVVFSTFFFLSHSTLLKSRFIIIRNTLSLPCSVELCRLFGSRCLICNVMCHLRFLHSYYLLCLSQQYPEIFC